MSDKQIEKKLGRGIASLLKMDDDLCAELHIDTQTIGDDRFGIDSSGSDKTCDQNFCNELQELNIDDIEPNPSQPRRYFNESKLKELSVSIKNNGLIQPIIVKINSDDERMKGGCKKYTIIAGERRYRASKIANLKSIKAIVLDIKEQEILKKAVIENVQREDLNPIEEANSYRHIIDAFNYTHEQLAKEIGKSRAYVTNLLRILSLPDGVRLAIQNNNISLGHAKVLLSVENPEKYLNIVIQQQLSVRQLERLIASDCQNRQNDNSRVRKGNVKNKIGVDAVDDDVASLVEKIYTNNYIEESDDIDRQLFEISGLNLHFSYEGDVRKVEMIVNDKNDLLKLLNSISRHKKQ